MDADKGKNNGRSGQPPRFEERERGGDLGTGAEVRGFEEITQTRDARKGDEVPKDHDRAYGWSGGYGEERTNREKELTERDADAARGGESREDPKDRRREDDNSPEDPDVGETGREGDRAY